VTAKSIALDRSKEDGAILRQARREKATFLALVLPALTVIFLLLLVPVGWLFWLSVYDGGFTAAHYARIVRDGAYWQSFLTTFEISLLVTALVILIGYPLSYMLAQLPSRLATLGLFLVLIPFWTSILVRTYAWLVLLQRQGLINDALIGLGVVDQPLTLVHNFTGTVIGMVHILMPFLILPLYATMRSIDPELVKAGASLGASPTRTFWQVFFPLSMPGLVAGALLVFVLSLGFYITPELLGGGRTVMISMLIQRNVELYFEWGAASSVAVVLLALIFAVFWIMNRFLAIERIFGVR
jgi:putative spermidine/putrescine transport system permease protein